MNSQGPFTASQCKHFFDVYCRFLDLFDCSSIFYFVSSSLSLVVNRPFHSCLSVFIHQQLQCAKLSKENGKLFLKNIFFCFCLFQIILIGRYHSSCPAHVRFDLALAFGRSTFPCTFVLLANSLINSLVVQNFN